MKITISKAKLLAAASVCVADDDVRYYLEGVLIERAPDGKGAIIVATDGARLIALRDEQAAFSDSVPVQTIVAFDKASLLAMRKKSNADIPVTVEFSSTVDGVSLTTIILNGQQFGNQARIIDGTFPDWRRVCASTRGADLPAPGLYNPAFLGDWSKICLYLTGQRDKQSICMKAKDASSAAQVFFVGIEYAVGLLMPQRPSKNNAGLLSDLPQWATL